MSDRNWVLIAESTESQERAEVDVASWHIKGESVLAWIKRRLPGVDKRNGKAVSDGIFLIEYDLAKKMAKQYKMLLSYEDGSFSETFKVEDEWREAEAWMAKELEGIRNVMQIKPKKKWWPFN